ncbi:MAG: phosphonate ABC transporter, permease protein PhnE [Halocynthiibacter sp.]
MRALWPSVLIGAAVLWAGATTEVDPERLAASAGRMVEFLARMWPPDFTIMTELKKGLAETLRIAILGTLGSVVLSAGLSVLAAETVVGPLIWRPTRALLALIRSIPLILVAMLMVAAVGLGPLPGALAITFHATGMLAKFYSEAIDGVDRAPVLALEGTGATRLQRLRFGVWPQMAPVIMRDTIFRFELNLRESLILGVVGAGGIGFYIQTYVRSFQYEKAATVTLAIAALVLVIEALNSLLRRRFS